MLPIATDSPGAQEQRIPNIQDDGACERRGEREGETLLARVHLACVQSETLNELGGKTALARVSFCRTTDATTMAGNILAPAA